MGCNECENKEKQDMPESVPYIVYEGERVRSERIIKRLWIALIVLTLSFVTYALVNNASWLWAWMQYDYETVTVDSADGGNANYIGQDGDIYNGDGYSQKANQEETTDPS